MTVDCGDFLYCISGKYSSGKVIEVKNGKYFIQTSAEILEFDISEIEINFSKG